MGILRGSTKIAFGFGLGVMAAEIVREVLPAFRGTGRPLLKAAVKSGMILAENSRAKLANFTETLAEVTAEARAEMGGGAEKVVPDQPFTEKAKAAAGIM